MSFFDRYADKEFLPYLDAQDAGIPRPSDQDPMRGHGTHVGGIVMGGMYEKGAPKAGGENLLSPDVRRLLVYNPEVEKAQSAKPWLKIRYIPVGYGAGAAGTDPVAKLKQALDKADSASATIINMSLARTLTNVPNPYALPENLGKRILVVLAAGNATMPLASDINALPAKIEANRQLLIVASHDANGALSHFSNYGNPVELAAPGCQIRSWPQGEGDAQALSGTSMSTAVVSFASALVRSQWDAATGAAVRQRLLVSARYEPQLSLCDRARARTGIVSDPKECVRYGAMLDIEAAMLTRKDLLEYEVCADDSEMDCRTAIAVGELKAVTPSLVECIETKPDPALAYGGISRNGAVKRVAKGRYLIATEAGQAVGRVPLNWDMCDVSAEKAAEELRFDVAGLQLDGTTADTTQTLSVRLARVRRIVTRAN